MQVFAITAALAACVIAVAARAAKPFHSPVDPEPPRKLAQPILCVNETNCVSLREPAKTAVEAIWLRQNDSLAGGGQLDDATPSSSSENAARLAVVGEGADPTGKQSFVCFGGYGDLRCFGFGMPVHRKEGPGEERRLDALYDGKPVTCVERAWGLMCSDK